MKLKSLITTVALVLSVGVAFGKSNVPTGEINVAQSLVRTGIKPVVNWTITYPAQLADIAEVLDPGTIRIKMRTEVEIRVLGVAFQSGSTLLPAALQAKVNNKRWSTLFSGTAPQVDPSETVYTRIVNPGDTINLSARGGTTYGGWSFSANTLTSSPQVTHLRKGDHAPSYVPAYNQGSIEDYLSSYIAPDGTINAGSRDLVYLFELGTRNTDSSYFDMQDIAVVITFKDVED